MDRWERPVPPLRGGAAAARAKPSFSSTLLDAIYRSIDDNSDARPATSNLTGPTHKPITAKPRAAAAASTERRSRGEKPLPPPPPKQKHHHLNSATSSSSDSSSYNGFSSSPDTDPPFHPAGLRPIRTNPTPPPPPEKKKKNNSKTRSTGSVVSRLRDLKKQTAPASPGARLASFLNSLFSASGSPRRARPPPPPQAAAAAALPEPVCSTARSCLSKTTSSREGGVKRTVRFYPVSVVVGPDSRPCGHKSLRGGDPAARRPPAAAPAEGDDGDSDSSSDLFELENLGGSGGEYSDELPVYETTRVRAHRSVCQGW